MFQGFSFWMETFPRSQRSQRTGYDAKERQICVPAQLPKINFNQPFRIRKMTFAGESSPYFRPDRAPSPCGKRAFPLDR